MQPQLRVSLKYSAVPRANPSDMATELLLLDERPGIIMNQALAKVLTYGSREMASFLE